jgi:predicted aconitase
MYLTREEEKMYEGEDGEPLSQAIRVIVKVGEALGAERLIKIEHAHVSGLSYLTIGEPGLLFIKEFAIKGARTRVFSTINPVGMDLSSWKRFPIPPEFARKQEEIVKYMLMMGFSESMTCTPYLIREPRFGEHLAWGESSAVGMANTYYGAYTNREGGPIALMAAISGRTYYAGLHLEENRKPTIRIIVRDKEVLKDPGAAGVLGYLVGERVGEGVPLLELPGKPVYESIKAYTAAAGATGSIALTIIPGITPSIKITGKEDIEKIEIDNKEISGLLPNDKAEIDLILIGCPHATIEEMAFVKKLIEKCGGKSPVKIWIATSRKTYRDAEKIGLTKALSEERNVFITRDTCPVVSPILKNRARTVLTTSGKSYFYIPRIQGVRTIPITHKKLGELLCRNNSN